MHIYIILYILGIHRQEKNWKYRVGTRKCVCTHAMRHLGVSVCIVKVIGGYGYGTQNCDCYPVYTDSVWLDKFGTVCCWPRLHLNVLYN